MHRIAAIALVTTALLCATICANVSTVTYFGGSGDDAVTGAAFASDGSILLGGTSTSPTLAGIPGTVLGSGAGFVAKLDRAGQALVWLVRMPDVKELLVDSKDNIYVRLDRSVAVLAANGSAFVRQGADLGASTVDMDLAPDGSIAVLAGGNARLLKPDGSEAWNKAVGRAHPLSIAINPTTLDVWVGGDQNTNTGFEPYRSPFLFQYAAAAGDRTTVLWDWSGPAVRANGLQLQADSFITFLKFASTGQLWIGAGSDGGNTVLTKEPDSLELAQDALAGACFSGPCFGYKGAKKTGLFARMNTAGTDMERASWVIPYVGMNPGTHMDPPCGCKGGNFNAASGVNPGSFGVSAVLPIDKGVIILGNPYGKGSATPDGWFYNTVYTAGGIGWMGVFSDDLTQITQASMIPGSRDAHGDYRGGRLVVAGKAVDFSAATRDTAEADWDASLPVTQTALQKTYAGGASDGYLVLACMTSAQECGASVRDGSGERTRRGRHAFPVLDARGLLLGPSPASGVFLLTSISGVVLASGVIPADRRITLTHALTGGTCILRVSAPGVSQAWRIVSRD